MTRTLLARALLLLCSPAAADFDRTGGIGNVVMGHNAEAGLAARAGTHTKSKAPPAGREGCESWCNEWTCWQDVCVMCGKEAGCPDHPPPSPSPPSPLPPPAPPNPPPSPPGPPPDGPDIPPPFPPEPPRPPPHRPPRPNWPPNVPPQSPTRPPPWPPHHGAQTTAPPPPPTSFIVAAPPPDAAANGQVPVPQLAAGLLFFALYAGFIRARRAAEGDHPREDDHMPMRPCGKGSHLKREQVEMADREAADDDDASQTSSCNTSLPSTPTHSKTCGMSPRRGGLKFGASPARSLTNYA
uniref:Uncharacterized protein n=2 Tax=Prymnesium polylepis TaxID=72548 RepID=A0A7S4HEQ2_9EUKA